MDTLLYNGDHYTDARGLPVTLTGDQELVQRALIRLQVKRGSFLPDPTLGSELYKLRRSAGEQNSRLAMAYVQEALADLPELSVRRVDCALSGLEDLLVTVQVAAGTEQYQLEVTL